MRSKIDQAMRILHERDIECWVILLREGKEKSIEMLLEREFIGESAFIFTPKSKKAIVASYDRDRVENMECTVYEKGITEVVSAEIKRIAPENIHMNFSKHDHTADSLTHGLFLKFQDILHNLGFEGEIRSSEIFLEELRSVKTEEEIGRITEAVKITEEIFDALPEMVTKGITEREILTKMTEMAERKGCGLAWDEPAVTFGLETELGHRIPSERKLKKKESIHIDFGVNYEGYCSDIQRVFFYGGTPPEKMKRAFETIRKAQKDSINAIEPGKKGYEIDAVARKVITDAGYPEYNHGLGHQVGREVHDGGCILAPRWERYEKNARKKLREGNVFTIEPTIRGEVNLGLEDDIVVGKKASPISHPQKEIREIY